MKSPFLPLALSGGGGGGGEDGGGGGGGGGGGDIQVIANLTLLGVIFCGWAEPVSVRWIMAKSEHDSTLDTPQLTSHPLLDDRESAPHWGVTPDTGHPQSLPCQTVHWVEMTFLQS